LIDLTATEFELLRYLMRDPRRVLSKAEILDQVWSYDFGGPSAPGGASACVARALMIRRSTASDVASRVAVGSSWRHVRR
jgi:Transcriptional regulatory protein, C terminal